MMSEISIFFKKDFFKLNFPTKAFILTHIMKNQTILLLIFKKKKKYL